MSLDKKFLSYAEKLFNYCPYLKKSLDSNLLYTENYSINSDDEEEISKYIFYYSLIETEKFRKQRNLLSGKDLTLYCVNTIFDIYSSNINLEKIISWPHYILKELYSSERIMFGKFWVGEETISEIYNIMLPIPDINFISIRTAVTDRDPILLGDSELADKILNSIITDNNVNSDFFEEELPTDIDVLMKSGYYEFLKDKFTKILKSKKTKLSESQKSEYK